MSPTTHSERALAETRAFLGPNLWHQPNWWIRSSAVLGKELPLGRSADMCQTPYRSICRCHWSHFSIFRRSQAHTETLPRKTAPETCLCHIKLTATNIQFPDSEVGYSRIVE